MHRNRQARLNYSRRQFVTSAFAGSAALGLSPDLLFAQTGNTQTPALLGGTSFDLNIGYQAVNYTGQTRMATAINGTVPAPVLHWREGEEVSLRVTNNLAVDTSLHWHGIILPSNMDGVPGLSFAGIRPGETFEYHFKVKQSGTYWYHGHSGFQEQTGLYGPIIISPRDEEPFACDRDYVVMLSDWSDTAPEKIYANLKKMDSFYNFKRRTVGNLFNEIKEKGVAQTWNDRAMWNQMRMSDRDIADVTGYTYTYLMNGITPDPGWLGLFKAGEKIRLRFINGAAMSIFDVRIPGLKMTVIAADGQYIEPVSVDEFRIGVAETYDVIVAPETDIAYAIFSQSIDRSGYALGTLTPDINVKADIPVMDPRPVLGHMDMGMTMDMNMDMTGMTMSGENPMPDMTMSAMDMDHDAMNHATMPTENMPAESMPGMDHSQMDHGQMHQETTEMPVAAMTALPAMNSEKYGSAGYGSKSEITHPPSESGPQVSMRSEQARSGLHDPGIGLRDHQQLYQRKVLTYGDLRNLAPTLDSREPEREIELHLTGNMHRYLWSINGIPFSDAEPLHLRYGERVRITLVNDTMMTHPIHLHGMWSELETGVPENIPRKHTVIVQPGAKISYLVTADALGRWAYHCHLLYHMNGMFREVVVSEGASR